MYTRTQCPQCLAVFKVDEIFIAQPAACRKCGREFAITKMEESPIDRAIGTRAGTASERRLSAPAPISGAPLHSESKTATTSVAPVCMGASGPPDEQDSLSPVQLDQLRQAEACRRKIRIASVLCIIVFWIFTVDCIVYGLFTIVITAVANRAEERLGVGLLFLTTLIAGGLAVLAQRCAAANKRCERWAPMTMCILKSLGVVCAFVMGVVLAFEGGPLALGLMWIAAILPFVFAIMFYRSWAAIPEYLGQPRWCRHALEHCGL